MFSVFVILCLYLQFFIYFRCEGVSCLASGSAQIEAPLLFMQWNKNTNKIQMSQNGIGASNCMHQPSCYLKYNKYSYCIASRLSHMARTITYMLPSVPFKHSHPGCQKPNHNQKYFTKTNFSRPTYLIFSAYVTGNPTSFCSVSLQSRAQVNRNRN